MLERDRFQPIDSYIYTVAVVAARDFQVAATRRARTDKYRIEILLEQVFHAGDLVTEPQIRAHVHDHVDFFVQHLGRQAKRRDIGAHQATGGIEFFENHNFVAHRQQVIGHRQRCAASTDHGNLFAILLLGRFRQAIADVVTQIGGDPFQATNGNRFFLDPDTTASRLARPVADSAQDAGKHIRLPIQHVGVVESTLGDQPDIARHIRVRRTRPLAIDHLVVIIRVFGIDRIHDPFPYNGCDSQGALYSHIRGRQTSGGFWRLIAGVCGPTGNGFRSYRQPVETALSSLPKAPFISNNDY
ncbi:hypothetical protein MnTg04_00286 [bacterium MnTg04]|nr:hypothetical protein MnTg04_00286 [bacterium MnTg04]